MNKLFIKIFISLICIIAFIVLFASGDKLPIIEDKGEYIGQNKDEYIDAFKFEPVEIKYDGNGELDLLDGVTLDGYSKKELETLVFIRIYQDKSLSEKIIEYTAETKEGKVRSKRPLKLQNYSGPKIYIPDDVPDVTRDNIGHFGELLATKSDYVVDDGFGKDVREHATIQYEGDAKESSLVHYTISFNNMFGDSDVAKVDISLSGVPAYLSLTESEITLNRDGYFDPDAYIARVVLADGTDAHDKVLYSGNVNMDEIGIYEVTYELEGETLTLTVNVI